jgi:hypothetical protein
MKSKASKRLVYYAEFAKKTEAETEGSAHIFSGRKEELNQRISWVLPSSGNF